MSFLPSFRMDRLLLGCLLLAIGSLAQAADGPPRPNILLIMSDDMGYSDLGCYGGEINTPNLDALANGGVRFTQFYNTARCCPTRASLLTGLYPHQAGIGHMMEDRGHDGYRGNLNRECVTIPEVLKPAGYRTYMTGKWHVTRDIGPESNKANWPLQRGFEKYYGTLAGAGNYFNPGTLCRQNSLINLKEDPEYSVESYYYTDALADNAVKFLQQHQMESAEKPFFLYMAFTAAHWPMQAREEDIAKYRGKFAEGYGPHRSARLERIKQLGLVPDGIDLSPQAEDWDSVKHHEWENRCMEVYAAMIDRIDTGIGRVVDQLKSSGQFENTLIFFLQDNGACAETVGRGEEGATRGKTDDGRPIRTGPQAMPGPEDTFIAYGRGWANVSNTPFREYKHWVHEGGISTPLIAHWPAGIPKERNGTLERQPGHLIDLMATCVDLSGATYPTEREGKSIKPREGVSLKSGFSGKSLERPQPLFWEHEGNRAVRDGHWKLVAKENEPWELYDIDADRVESNNLAAKYPDRVKQMATQWDDYAKRANVLPLGSWRAASNSSKRGSKKLKFELSAHEELKNAQAPALSNRGFKVTALIDATASESQGVIVSQGGSRFGFSLYLRSGKPVFAVRTSDGVVEIQGAESLNGKHQIQATLTAAGILQLQVDGKPAADDVQAKLIPRQPGEGLQIGQDSGGTVSRYPAPFAFTGKIESVLLEMDSK